MLNDVLDVLGTPRGKQLYIHGVANQDPTAASGKASMIFVHRGEKSQVSTDAEKDIVLPAAVNAPKSVSGKDKVAAQAMATWVKMLEKYWREEPTGLGVVRVHSKIVVVDPLGKHPVVITGSHNLGPKASAVNDDNLVIIENEPQVAEQYAVNIITIYNQYRWRFQQLQAAKEKQPLNEWNGLTDPWKDQASYFKGDKARELAFWT